MNPGNTPAWKRVPIIAAGIVIALGTVWAGEARAACFTPQAKTPVNGARLQFAPAAALVPPGEASESAESFVGMWHTVFLIGNGPDRYDETIQQFHNDGTENMLSNGLPPTLGNVCLGLWRSVGPQTIKIKHMAWNWDSEGHFAGTFVMLAMLRLDRRGNAFNGTWVADNFDTNGNVIPEGHAQGVVRSTRIAVD